MVSFSVFSSAKSMRIPFLSKCLSLPASPICRDREPSRLTLDLAMGAWGGLEYIVGAPATAEHYRHMIDNDGNWMEREDVWIWYLDRKGKPQARVRFQSRGNRSRNFSSGTWSAIILRTRFC